MQISDDRWYGEEDDKTIWVPLTKCPTCGRSMYYSESASNWRCMFEDCPSRDTERNPPQLEREQYCPHCDRHVITELTGLDDMARWAWCCTRCSAKLDEFS